MVVSSYNSYSSKNTKDRFEVEFYQPFEETIILTDFKDEYEKISNSFYKSSITLKLKHMKDNIIKNL